MPPSRIERHRQRVAELAGVGQEVGLLEGVLGQEPLADELEPEFAAAGGNIAAISAIGASPRNRYIGFWNELPPVSSIASSVPSASSRRRHLDALVEPEPAARRRRPC